jgi:hypothetical protein
MQFWRGRQRRAGHRRGLVASVFGWTAIAIGGTLTLFFTWELIFPSTVPRDEGWKAWLAVVAITLAVSQFWFNIARRTKEAPREIPPTTAAASVLYLRAFDEEQRPFVFGPKSVLKQYTNQFVAHAPLQRGDPTLRLTLEDYLEEAITAQLGPFVALGNPYDRLVPDGATREYAPDDQWQTRFLDLAQGATCIVVSIGGSSNLEWELTQIRERGLGQKLCLFTSPIVPGTDTKILNKLRRTAARRAKTLDEDWARASETLRRAGFSCGANPGAGAAVIFDELGGSALLTTDATSPTEFIAPVADWFKNRQRSGRCVPVACRSCAAGTHVTSAAVAEGGLCYACRLKEERARMSFVDRHPLASGVWGFSALAIAAWLSVQVLHVDSWWAVIPLWIVVAALPIAVPAIVRAATQRLTRKPSAPQTER